MAGVDVHDGEGEACRPEGLLGQAQEHDRVLAPREQEHGPLELGRHLPHDEDGVSLQGIEVGELVARLPDWPGGGQSHGVLRVGLGWSAFGVSAWSPHSVLSVPGHRPARASSPVSTGRVQGAHPIEG